MEPRKCASCECEAAFTIKPLWDENAPEALRCPHCLLDDISPGGQLEVFVLMAAMVQRLGMSMRDVAVVSIDQFEAQRNSAEKN